MPTLQEQFGAIDIYLFDQLLVQNLRSMTTWVLRKMSGVRRTPA